MGKMRLLGRLTMAVQRKIGESTSLFDLLQPRHFDHFVEACNSLSNSSPQLAITAGHYLKYVLLLKVSCCIKEDRDVEQLNAEKFQRLFEAHWKTDVAAKATRKMRTRNIIGNVTNELPLSDDIRKLNRYLREKIACLSSTAGSANCLSKVLLASLIVFNRRRPMEVAEMKVQHFEGELSSKF